VDLRQDLAQKNLQTQKIAPNLIHANLLLQCSSAELQQIIEREQNENPALDGEEALSYDKGCAQCPGLNSLACRGCGSFEQDSLSSEWLKGDEASSNVPLSQIPLLGEEDSPEPLEDFTSSRLSSQDDFDLARDPVSFDPILLAPAETSLADHLLSQLRATSQGKSDNQISEFLVGSLDSDGYLRITSDEISLALGVTIAAVEAGIARLQSCDPPGVGARDIRECLLIQMKYLREENTEAVFNPLAECLVREHWRSLVTHRHKDIQDELGVSEDQLNAALNFIRNRLTPRPSAQFRQPWGRDTQGSAIHADVVISKTSTGFDIVVTGFENLALQVNPYYRSLYDNLNSIKPHGRESQISAAHARHVVTCVDRARLFLKNLSRRKNTIERISRALIDCQIGYISTGKRSFIRALTRAQLGEMVDLHESTVSRAVQHKYVQIPIGDVVPFDIFFGSVASAQEIIAQMIAEENVNSPLSDQAIAEALKARGMNIARRTVVKYREDMRIPASYLRRKR